MKKIRIVVSGDEKEKWQFSDVKCVEGILK
jgi:hypothetical protein